MATRTSIGSGKWGTAGTWDTGVPLDGDSVVITAGHSIEFDVDQSAWSTGILGLSIGAGSTLWASTTAGSYYLRLGAAITGSGTFLVGTSPAVFYPYNCKFQVYVAANLYLTDATYTGAVKVYCARPTYRWAKTTALANVGATVLSVDTDLTTDRWADGNTVLIGDSAPTHPDVERRVIAAGGIASGSITITAGLTTSKSSGSYVVLVTRNVNVIGSATTSGGFIGTTPVQGYIDYVDCSFSPSAGTMRDCVTGANRKWVFAGMSDAALAGGNPDDRPRAYFDGAVLYAPGAMYPGTMFKDSLLVAPSINSRNSIRLLGCRVVCTPYGLPGGTIVSSFTLSMESCLVENCSYCSGIGLGGDLYTDCQVVAPYLPYVLELRNCLMTAAAEVSMFGWQFIQTPYTGTPYLTQSFDHDQVANAFRAWSQGGVVSSVVTPVPTGRSRSYEHVCASAYVACYHERRVTVEGGRQLRARVWLRRASGVAIKAQLIDPAADPYVHLSASALDEYDISSLSTNTWYEDVLTWTNSGAVPKQILLRFHALAASGSAYSEFEFSFDRSDVGCHEAY